MDTEVNVLRGRSVCFVGDVSPFKREELQVLVKKLGGTYHANPVPQG